MEPTTTERLIAALKQVTPPPTGVFGHGPGGLFSYPGLERDLINAAAMPNLGLLGALPSRTSNSLNPLYGIVTGVTDVTGANPDGPCDDLPQAGLMKLCTRSAWWGFWGLATRVYDIKQAGFVTGRSEFNDHALIGGPDASNDAFPSFPDGSSTMAQALRAEAAKVRTEFAVSWARRWAGKVYNANPANNTAGGGYQEPYGLDYLINTGYQDAVTGAQCPAADSLVVDAAGLDVDGDGNGVTVVRHLVSMYRYLSTLARDTGLDPTTWALVMPDALFTVLSEVWPCAYYTYRCIVDGGTSQGTSMPSGQALTNARDEMRQGQFLLIDGARVQVITDNTAPSTEPDPGLEPGTYEADIYFVPMRVLGSRPATYIEYFDWTAPNAAMEMASLMAPDGTYFATNGGRYLWEKRAPHNGCVQAQAWTRWRLILETPQLAARYANLRYTPLLMTRGVMPGDPGFVNGGATEGPATVYQPPIGV